VLVQNDSLYEAPERGYKGWSDRDIPVESESYVQEHFVLNESAVSPFHTSSEVVEVD
jgi:hypothetical protein